jgi:hypothetical protein
MNEVVPDVQIDGALWMLIARRGKKNLIAYGKTLGIAVKNMEFKYSVAVKLPNRYAPFAEVMAEDYNGELETSDG